MDTFWGDSEIKCRNFFGRYTRMYLVPQNSSTDYRHVAVLN